MAMTQTGCHLCGTRLFSDSADSSGVIQSKPGSYQASSSGQQSPREYPIVNGITKPRSVSILLRAPLSTNIRKRNIGF